MQITSALYDCSNADVREPLLHDLRSNVPLIAQESGHRAAPRRTAAAPSSIRSACPTGWNTAGDRCVVRTSSTFKNQADADAFCRSLHSSGQGMLAKVTSSGQLDQFASAAGLSSSVTYWVGMRWSERAQAIIHNDGTQQPPGSLPRNDFDSILATPCVVMRRELVLLFYLDWTLHDEPCSLASAVPAMCSMPRTVTTSEVYVPLAGRHTWQNARALCRTQGMSLATPRSATEANFLLSFSATDGAVWAGLSTISNTTLTVNSWQVDSGLSPAAVSPAVPTGPASPQAPSCPGACGTVKNSGGTPTMTQGDCCLLKKAVCERPPPHIQPGACPPGWLHDRVQGTCLRIVPGLVPVHTALATCAALGSTVWQPHLGYDYFAQWILTHTSQGKVWTSLAQGAGVQWDSIHSGVSFQGISGSSDILATAARQASGSNFDFAGASAGTLANAVCSKPALGGDTDTVCPPRWIRVQNKCFRAFPQLTGHFSSAEFACNSVGATSLAVLANDLEVAAAAGAVLSAAGSLVLSSQLKLPSEIQPGWVGVSPGAGPSDPPVWVDGTALCGPYPDTFTAGCSAAPLGDFRVAIGVTASSSSLSRQHRSTSSAPVCQYDASTVACRAGYKYFKGLCVGLEASQTGTWAAAESTCRSVGGSLAAIDTADKQQWLVQQSLLNHGANSWVGLTSSVAQGASEWFWMNGQVATFIPWVNAAPAAADGSCAFHQNTGTAAAQSKVTARNCLSTLTNKPLCEMEAFSPGQGGSSMTTGCDLQHRGSCISVDSTAEVPLPTASSICFQQGGGNLMAVHSAAKQMAINAELPAPINPATSLASVYTSGLIPVAPAYDIADYVTQISSLPSWVWEFDSLSSPKWHSWNVGSPVLIGGLGLLDQTAVWAAVAGALKMEVVDRNTKQVIPACEQPRIEKCPPGWTFLHALPDEPQDSAQALQYGSCYIRAGAAASWDQASNICQSKEELGGAARMLIVESQSEQQALSAWVGSSDSAWLGLRQSAPGSGVFVSTNATGETPIVFKSTSTNSWLQWETPLDLNSGKECVFWRGSDSAWALAGCAELHQVICETVAIIPWSPTHALVAFDPSRDVGRQLPALALGLQAQQAGPLTLYTETASTPECAYRAEVEAMRLLHENGQSSILEFNEAGMFSAELFAMLSASTSAPSAFRFAAAQPASKLVMEIDSADPLNGVSLLLQASDSVLIKFLSVFDAFGTEKVVLPAAGECVLGGTSATTAHCQQWAGPGKWTTFSLLHSFIAKTVVIGLDVSPLQSGYFQLSGIAIAVVPADCCTTVSAGEAASVSSSPASAPTGELLRSMIGVFHPQRFLQQDATATQFSYQVQLAHPAHIAGVALRLESGSRFSGLKLTVGQADSFFPCRAGEVGGNGALDYSTECAEFNGNSRWSFFMLAEPELGASTLQLDFARAGQASAAGVSFDGLAVLHAQRACFPPSPSPTVSPSASPSASQSATSSPSHSASVSATQTATISATTTVSPSATASVSQTPAVTVSATASGSATPSATQSGTPSHSTSVSSSATASHSSTPSMSPTSSVSGSVSATSSGTPSQTPTASWSPSNTASSNPTVSSTPSGSVSSSGTVSATTSAIVSSSPSASFSAGATPSHSVSSTAEITSPPTPSVSATITALATGTPSPMATAAETATPSASSALTASPSAFTTPSQTVSTTPSAATSSSNTAAPTPGAPGAPFVELYSAFEDADHGPVPNQLPPGFQIILPNHVFFRVSQQRSGEIESGGNARFVVQSCHISQQLSTAAANSPAASGTPCDASLFAVSNTTLQSIDSVVEGTLELSMSATAAAGGKSLVPSTAIASTDMLCTLTLGVIHVGTSALVSNSLRVRVVISSARSSPVSPPSLFATGVVGMQTKNGVSVQTLSLLLRHAPSDTISVIFAPNFVFTNKITQVAADSSSGLTAGSFLSLVTVNVDTTLAVLSGTPTVSKIVFAIGRRLHSVPITVRRMDLSLQTAPVRVRFVAQTEGPAAFQGKLVELKNASPLTVRWDLQDLQGIDNALVHPTLNPSGGFLRPRASVLVQFGLRLVNTSAQHQLQGLPELDGHFRIRNHLNVSSIAVALPVTVIFAQSRFCSSSAGDLQLQLSPTSPQATAQLELEGVQGMCEHGVQLNVLITPALDLDLGQTNATAPSVSLREGSTVLSAELSVLEAHAGEIGFTSTPFQVTSKETAQGILPGSGQQALIAVSVLRAMSPNACSKVQPASLHVLLNIARSTPNEHITSTNSLQPSVPGLLDSFGYYNVKYYVSQLAPGSPLNTTASTNSSGSEKHQIGSSRVIQVASLRGTPHPRFSQLLPHTSGSCASVGASSRARLSVGLQQPSLLSNRSLHVVPNDWYSSVPCIQISVSLADFAGSPASAVKFGSIVKVASLSSACRVELLQSAQAGTLQAYTIQPIKPGHCIISATIDSRHLVGSPLSLRVQPAACDGVGQQPSSDGLACTCQPGFQSAVLSQNGSGHLPVQTTCVACSVGFASPGGPNAKCTPCMGGLVSNLARSRCVACPNARGIHCLTGTVSVEPGFWCARCQSLVQVGSASRMLQLQKHLGLQHPVGLEFELEGNRRLLQGTDIQVDYSDSYAMAVARCINAPACLSAGNGTACAVGHEGPLCGSCVEGYALGTGSMCHKCPNADFVLICKAAGTLLVSVLLLTAPFWAWLRAGDTAWSSRTWASCIRIWGRWAQAAAVLCASQVAQGSQASLLGLVHLIADAAFVFPVTSHSGRCLLHQLQFGVYQGAQVALFAFPVVMLGILLCGLCLYAIWSVMWPLVAAILRRACPGSFLLRDLVVHTSAESTIPGGGKTVRFETVSPLSVQWMNFSRSLARVAVGAGWALFGTVLLLSLRVFNVHSRLIDGKHVLEADTNLSSSDDAYNSAWVVAAGAVLVWCLAVPGALLVKQISLNPHAYQVEITRRLRKVTFTTMSKSQLQLLGDSPNKLLNSFGYAAVGFSRPALSWVHLRVHHTRCCLEVHCCRSRQGNAAQSGSLVSCAGITHNYRWATWAVQLLFHGLLLSAFGMTSRPLLQSQAALGIVLGSLSVQMMTMPYCHSWLNALEVNQHLTFAMACALGAFSEASAERRYALLAPNLVQTVALGWLLVAPLLVAVGASIEARAGCIAAATRFWTNSDDSQPLLSPTVEIVENSVSANTPEPSFFSPARAASPKAAAAAGIVEVVSLMESLSAVADREDSGTASLQILKSFGSDGSGRRVRARQAPTSPIRWPSYEDSSSDSSSSGSLSSIELPSDSSQ